MTHTRLRQILPLMALIALLLPQEANAHHDGLHLEVTPEVQNVQVGATGVMWAYLVGNGGGPAQAFRDTKINFENEGGANDADNGTSRNSPDFSCVIPGGSTTCFVEVTGNSIGKATFRAWIDESLFGISDSSDENEQRFAGLRDCDQLEDEPSDCAIDPNGPPVAGTTCRGTANPVPPNGVPQQPQPPGSEPDCTDVVEITFDAGTAGTIDCDDAGPPDTEHETNPATAQTGGQSPTETYTCSVRDQQGNLKAGAKVFAEIINGANDPDNGASYTSPDFPECTTAQNDNPLTPEVESRGTCRIPVSPKATAERGVATVCFWVGDLSEGAENCSAETAGTGASEDGSDQGDNTVDVVELAWENLDELVLDCSPEDGFSLTNSTTLIDCGVVSPRTDRPVQGITIRAEATGANDSDGSDSPQTQDGQALEPLMCETAADGHCSIAHPGEDPGETTYRAWIDDGIPEPDTTDPRGPDLDVDRTEGRDEHFVPGNRDEPDSTDVVISDWGLGPTQVVMAPRDSDASVGDCHEITTTATDESGEPTKGVRIDVEQKHERAENSTTNDEPSTDFCTPIAGPNPSDVDPSLGDVRSSDSAATSPGMNGGEAVQLTNERGEVTIGVVTEPANGSDGTGSVRLTTWWETDDDDDPSGADPSDAGLVRWEATDNIATLELTPDVSSADLGTETTYTATVTENGAPIEGLQLSWSSAGNGSFTWTEETTDSDGHAIATVTSTTTGSMTVTATCTGTYKCSDTSTQNWGPAMCDVIGTDGPDTLTGTDASETICGFEGDDVIDGGGGDDVIIGAGGDDHIVGGTGLDELLGDEGDDVLDGGTEDDQAFAGTGNDLITGGTGNDELYGDDGRDQVSGSAGDDEVYGGRAIDKLVGNAGNDNLYGESGKDEIFGNAGKDVLRGGDGGDRLVGGGGEDLLIGEKGRDSLESDGRDRCVEREPPSSKSVNC